MVRRRRGHGFLDKVDTLTIEPLRLAKTALARTGIPKIITDNPNVALAFRVLGEIGHQLLAELQGAALRLLPLQASAPILEAVGHADEGSHQPFSIFKFAGIISRQFFELGQAPAPDRLSLLVTMHRLQKPSPLLEIMGQ